MNHSGAPSTSVNSCPNRSSIRRWDEPSVRKRRRVHIDRTFEDVITTSTQGHQRPRTPQRTADVPSDTVLEVILIDLPPFCRYGSKGGSKKRRTWIKKQLEFLQIDRGLHISEHCIVDDALRVTYFHQTTSINPQTIPSEAELSDSVFFSAGRTLSLPRARIEGHEATLNANNWTDSTESLPSGNISQSMFSVQSPSCYDVSVSTVAIFFCLLPYVCDIPVRRLEVGNPRKLSTPWLHLFSLSLRDIGYYGELSCNAASPRASRTYYSYESTPRVHRTIIRRFYASFSFRSPLP